ncbi:MAG: sugar phosphate isomerase/epimerase [Phycisphaerales bacterium]|nr:sugar phosphate isomerase/epimerase [Phycisphaerales bacterium]
MNLRLAYSCNAYMKTTLDDALARIAAIGYRGVELMADTPHLWPDDVTPATIDATLAALDRHRLEISNINAFMMNKVGDPRQPYWHPSWIEADSAYRRIRIDHTMAAVTLARRLGAPHITTEPGGPIEGDMTYAKAMDLFVEQLKPVVEHAENENVGLLIEPEPELLIERFEQYLELRDRIDSPFMNLNFDIGHAYCVGEDPQNFVARMAPHTRHYHIEDIADTRRHHHLVPGTGAIDFRATLAAIRDSDYGGWITVELYPFVDDPDAAGRAAKSHLESIAADL